MFLPFVSSSIALFSCSVLGTQQLRKKACCLIIIYDRVKVYTYHRDFQLIHDNKKFLHLLDLNSLLYFRYIDQSSTIKSISTNGM